MGGIAVLTGLIAYCPAWAVCGINTSATKQTKTGSAKPGLIAGESELSKAKSVYGSEVEEVHVMTDSVIQKNEKPTAAFVLSLLAGLWMLAAGAMMRGYGWGGMIWAGTDGEG